MSRLSIQTDFVACRRLCVKITQAATLCRYAGHTVNLQSLHLVHTSRGYTVPLHQHTQYEGIVMLSGHAWETTVTRQLLTPGTLLLHAPNSPHRWEAPDAAVDRLGLWFTVTPHLPVPPLGIKPESAETVEKIDALLREAQTVTPGWRERMNARLTLLLADVLAPAAWPDEAYGESPVHPRGHIATLVEQFLCDNYAQSLTLGDIADQVGMSIPTLARHFRHEIGTSVMARLEAIRIEAAMRLLAETSLTIADIGTQVGFHDPSYFTRRFRQHTGMTPQQYRQQQDKPHAG